MEEYKLYIARLEKENRSLKQELSDLKKKLSLLFSSNLVKDSHNSFLPPSQDSPSSKCTQSTRKKSERKTGGQEEHKGSTLEFSWDTLKIWGLSK